MPFYEYYCPEHGRFTVSQSMFSEHKADCPSCSKPAERRFSCNFRSAEPLTIYQELPGGKGYQVVGWKADSGISPKPGEPYKTVKEVNMEEEISKHEAYKLHKEV